MHESEWSVTAEEEGEFREKHSKEKKKSIQQVHSKYKSKLYLYATC